MTGVRPLFGGIEAGGTKFVLAVGHSPTEILARHALPTRAPEATLRQTEAWFREQGPLAALGIASFGPAVVDRAAGAISRRRPSPAGRAATLPAISRAHSMFRSASTPM